MERSNVIKKQKKFGNVRSIVIFLIKISNDGNTSRNISSLYSKNPAKNFEDATIMYEKSMDLDAFSKERNSIFKAFPQVSTIQLSENENLYSRNEDGEMVSKRYLEKIKENRRISNFEYKEESEESQINSGISYKPEIILEKSLPKPDIFSTQRDPQLKSDTERFFVEINSPSTTKRNNILHQNSNSPLTPTLHKGETNEYEIDEESKSLM